MSSVHAEPKHAIRESDGEKVAQARLTIAPGDVTIAPKAKAIFVAVLWEWGHSCNLECQCSMASTSPS